jgi:20S proteasome alpha/beta subunit
MPQKRPSPPSAQAPHFRAHQKRGPGVTVCIAAICSLPNGALAVIGVSDRMLTVGDVEFEPPQQKVYSLAPLAPRAAILVAGDTAAQISICNATAAKLPKTPPPAGAEIEAIANLYAAEFIKYRQRESEGVVLTPLGLTLDSFIGRQKEMAPEQVQRLVTDLRRYEFGVEAIICGVDASGPHIFTVSNPGVVYCHDPVAFAAIGIGGRHAESQFMLASYVRDWPLSHALLLTYSAKRRAEVAPGVGKGTDLLFIEAGGTIIQVSDAIQQKLGDLYTKIVEREAEAATKAREEVDGFIKALLNPPTPPPMPATITPKG